MNIIPYRAVNSTTALLGRTLAIETKLHFDNELLVSDYLSLVKVLISSNQFSDAQNAILTTLPFIRQLTPQKQAWTLNIAIRDLRLCYLGGQQNLSCLVPLLREALTNSYIADFMRVNLMNYLIDYGPKIDKKHSYSWLQNITQKRFKELNEYSEEKIWFKHNVGAHTDDHQKDIQALKELIPFRKIHYGDTDFSVIGSYMRLGDLYSATGETILARKTYMEALLRTQKLPINCSGDYWYIRLCKNIKKANQT